jgi:predicted nucleotide-binding protein
MTEVSHGVDAERPFIWDAFVSYASADSSFAEELYHRLTERGYHVFYDKNEIRPGESIPVAIERALENSRRLLLLISQHALSSNWISGEWRTALYRDPANRRQLLLPIMIEDTRAALPVALSQFAILDASRGLSDDVFAQITRALGPPQEAKGPSTSEPTRPSTEKPWTFELSIDRDFDTYSASEQEQLLRAIEQVLQLHTGEMRITQKKRGSVRYRIMLEPEQAARLFLAVQNGELDQFRIKEAAMDQAGNKVFIGHGRSPLWRELKDFIADRLRLEWDEFNREPVAGVTTSERLHKMLDQASFAFLVMTAEDEHADTSLHARENVIHEVGLFQGRLGPRKAIILLEEGCAEFSNVGGLGQIRFPRGNIAACFEDVRRVLERETISQVRS